MNVSSQAARENSSATPSVIEIELLALDLNSCTRCVGTLNHIEKAIDVIQPLFAITETRVNVKKIVVDSEEQARQHRFVTSPTVRINGKNIVFETLESQCDSCTDLCGCDEGTNCRVWRYRGQEYTEAPVGLVVESILREIFGGQREPANLIPGYDDVPENLQNFFDAKSTSRSAAETCCSTSKQEECCEPSEKSTCCDSAEPETCGCA